MNKQKMPLSTLATLPNESSAKASAPNQQMLVNNQNMLHVKFHVNKFQDNLLSKRLQQLNMEEMKLRLKHQRASNELVVFLKECQQTTGYLSKMKQIDNNHSRDPSRNRHMDTNDMETSRLTFSSSNKHNFHPPLSNAVKNMINASILVVDTDESTFESKSCPNYAHLNSANGNQLHRQRNKTALPDGNHISSASSNQSLKKSKNLTRKKSGSKSSKSFRRVRSQSNTIATINEHPELVVVKNSTPVPPSTLTDEEGDENNNTYVEEANNQSNLSINRLCKSKSASAFISQAKHDNNSLPSSYLQETSSTNKIPLFEHILLNSNSSFKNKKNNKDRNNNNITSSSRSRNSSTFSSSSQESINDITINKSTKFIDTSSTCHENLPRKETFQPQIQQRIRPITCNIARSNRKPVLQHRPSMESFKKVQPPQAEPILSTVSSSTINFSNSTTLSALDWFTTNKTKFANNPIGENDDEIDENKHTCVDPNDSSISSIIGADTSRTIPNLFTKNPNNNKKTKKVVLLKKCKKKQTFTDQSPSNLTGPSSDFKSRSLNFLLNSTLTFNSKNSNAITPVDSSKKSSFSSSSSSSSSYCTNSSLTTSDKSSANLFNKSLNGPKKVSSSNDQEIQLFVKKQPPNSQRHFKSSVCCSSINTHSSGSSVTTNSTATSALTNYLAAAPGQPNTALLHLPMRAQQRSQPIRVNMSRASMKKKQMEIISEYNRYNTLELLSNLRKIQQNLDLKVKQFTNKTIKECL